MNKSMLLALLGAVAVNTVATAAPADDISLSDDKRIVTANHGVRSFTPAQVNKARLTPIYDNFATHYPKGVYIASSGYAVGGPNSAVGQLWLASAFKPAQSATITEVDVAAGYIEGTKNLVLVSIYADKSGVPGKMLWSQKTRLPTEGDCCAVAKLPNQSGVAVTAGTQYWVGITTLPTGSDTFASWNFNDTDQVDPGLTAENQGSGWVAGTSLPNVAFGVYGK